MSSTLTVVASSLTALMTATVRIHPFVAGLSAFLVLPLAVGGVVLCRLSLTTPDNHRGLLYSLLLLPWMSLTFTALVATTALLGTPAWAGF